jgi:hypothetical protein
MMSVKISASIPKLVVTLEAKQYLIILNLVQHTLVAPLPRLRFAEMRRQQLLLRSQLAVSVCCVLSPRAIVRHRLLCLCLRMTRPSRLPSRTTSSARSCGRRRSCGGRCRRARGPRTLAGPWSCSWRNCRAGSSNTRVCSESRPSERAQP